MGGSKEEGRCSGDAKAGSVELERKKLWREVCSSLLNVSVEALVELK